MTRMPMNAVTATPLLLMLLLTTMPTQIFGRAAGITSVTETTPSDEETTYAGDLETNTVTIEVDSEVILTTEEGIQMFTHMPENGQATTEEPLPESVRQQLEQERAEQELRNPTTETTTTPLSNIAEKLVASNLTTTTTEQTSAANTERSAELAQYRDYLQMQEDLLMETEKLAAYIETATILPDIAKPINNLEAHFNTEDTAMIAESAKSIDGDDETTQTESQQLDSSTNEPILFESFSTATDSNLLMETTMMPNNDTNDFKTSPVTESDSELVTNRPTESDYDPIQKSLLHFLGVMSSNAVAEMPKMEPEAQFSNNEEAKLEFTTDSALPESSTTEAMPETTVYIAPPESSTIHITETVPETTIAPPREQSMLATILLTTARASETMTTPSTISSSTTTESVLIPTTSTTTSESVPIPTISSTISESGPIPATSSATTESVLISTTSSTTTESVPIPTTSSTTTESVLIPTVSSTTTEVVPIATASWTTTESVPIPTISSITTELVPIPITSSITLESVAIPTTSSTTTESVPIPTTSSTTTESVPIPTTSSTTTESVLIPTASSTTTESVLIPTTSWTTTESTPIPTTEVRPQPTRAPRIERILNTDGVEVLYGYSSVVRTNRS
ncbi:flocculation protein FLO11 [Drosophila grimshawi]|uniref:flocculation protein FLO11 n=1 Tax=Drosophila grimshawi TaxID=7222 RepID=UPI001C9341C5|nr:flocculation protein FLO11 [Drosophila grimshawi]